jgi:hypothetical protein
MSLGVSYREACMAAKGLRMHDAHKKGLWMSEVLRLTARLGVPHMRVSPAHAPERDGIMGLRRADKVHAIAVFEGIAFNPADGLAWHLQTYLSHARMTPQYYLVRRD